MPAWLWCKSPSLPLNRARSSAAARLHTLHAPGRPLHAACCIWAGVKHPCHAARQQPCCLSPAMATCGITGGSQRRVMHEVSLMQLHDLAAQHAEPRPATCQCTPPRHPAFASLYTHAPTPRITSCQQTGSHHTCQTPASQHPPGPAPRPAPPSAQPSRLP